MRPENKTIIVANTAEAFGRQMQRTADSPAGQEMIRHTHTLAQRAFFWEGDNKIVVTPYPIPQLLILVNSRILGWNEVTNLYPVSVSMNLSLDILGDSRLWAELVKAVKNNCGAEITSYAVTPEFSALVKRLMEADLDFCLRERNASVALVDYLDSKAGFRETAGVAMPEGYITSSQKEAMARAVWFYQQGRSAVVKDNKGGSGWGALMLHGDEFENSEELKKYIETKFDQDRVWEVGPYVVEELVDIDFNVAGGSPSTEVYITDLGPEITYDCEQVVNERGEFLGVGIGREAIPDLFKNQVRDLVITVGNKYWQLGYRGFFDVDMVVSIKGKVYAVETNVRRTGGTHVYDLGRAIWGEDQSDWGYLLSEDTFRYGEKALTAEKVLGRSEDWLFPKINKGEGVVICMIDPTDPVMGYVVAAKNKARAVEIQREFRNIW